MSAVVTRVVSQMVIMRWTLCRLHQTLWWTCISAMLSRIWHYTAESGMQDSICTICTSCKEVLQCSTIK